MVQPVSQLDLLYGVVAAAGSWCVCLVAWLVALEIYRPGAKPSLIGLPPLLAAAVAAGVSGWASPALATRWPLEVGFAPAAVIASVVVSVSAVAWGLGVERRFPDSRGLIGGGAILGAGIALGQGLLLLGLSGPAELDFSDVPVATSAACSSPLAVAALFIYRRFKSPVGELGAAACLATATALSTLAGWSCVNLSPDVSPIFGIGPTTVPAARMAPLAGMVLMAVLLGLRLASRPPRYPRHQGAGRARKSAAFSSAPPSLNNVASSSDRPIS